MISRTNTVNLSNMPATSEYVVSNLPSGFDPSLNGLIGPLKDEGDNWQVTKFQSSPLMSTYIVAWANGPFKYLETSVDLPVSQKTIPLRIYGLLGPSIFSAYAYRLFSHCRQYTSNPVCSRCDKDRPSHL
jgi:hypothetical protein